MGKNIWRKILVIDQKAWTDPQNLRFSALLALKIGSLIGISIVFFKIFFGLLRWEVFQSAFFVQVFIFILLLMVHLSCRDIRSVPRGSRILLLSLTIAFIVAMLSSRNPYYSGTYHYVSSILLFAGFLLGMRYSVGLCLLFSLIYLGFIWGWWTPLHPNSLAATLPIPTNLYVDRMIELVIVTLFVGLYHRLKERQYQIIGNQERANIHKEKLLSINRMAGGIAHEINNPLAIVMGYVEILTNLDKNKPLDPRILSRVMHSCERISSIVRNILNLTRETDGSMEVIDLQQSCLAQCMSLAKIPDLAQVHYQLDLIPIRFRMPGTYWELIISALIENAFEAVAALPKADVKISSYLTEGAIMITVTDSGPMFDEKQIASFFEPFFTSKTDDYGRGMGLTIAYGLATRLGWMITIRREKNHTITTLKMPLASIQLLPIAS